jgi:hypothetical protein
LRKFFQQLRQIKARMKMLHRGRARKSTLDQPRR